MPILGHIGLILIGPHHNQSDLPVPYLSLDPLGVPSVLLKGGKPPLCDIWVPTGNDLVEDPVAPGVHFGIAREIVDFLLNDEPEVTRAREMQREKGIIGD